MKLTKEKVPFTQVANEVINNPALSLRAKAVYAYLFSKPEGWDFSAERMQKECKDGRKTILTALKELIEAGYVDRKKLGNGKVEYLLKYSTQSAPRELRVEEPKCPGGTVPQEHGAPEGSISNKENPSNKDTESNNSAGVLAQAFDLKKEIQRMEEHPRRDLQIIGLYFKQRRPDIRSVSQLSKAIRRHLRPAKDLVPFDDDQIIRGFRRAAEQTPGWTIETAVKMLTK